jgi:methylase of polypeptide subunit release factors
VRIIGYDISQSAIQLARENIESAGLDVEVHEADILDKCFSEKVRIDMGDQVDLVVSNPPYIPFDEYRELPASVRDYEDPAALLGDKTGGTSGLQFYERIAELLPTMLSTKKQVEEAGWKGIPRVAVEIGHLQGRDVSSIMRNGGMSRTEVWPDQYGKDRMVLGWD